MYKLYICIFSIHTLLNHYISCTHDYSCAYVSPLPPSLSLSLSLRMREREGEKEGGRKRGSREGQIEGGRGKEAEIEDKL